MLSSGSLNASFRERSCKKEDSQVSIDGASGFPLLVMLPRGLRSCADLKALYSVRRIRDIAMQQGQEPPGCTSPCLRCITAARSAESRTGAEAASVAIGFRWHHHAIVPDSEHVGLDSAEAAAERHRKRRAVVGLEWPSEVSVPWARGKWGRSSPEAIVAHVSAATCSGKPD